MFLRFQKFEYNIVYKKGVEMYVVDILSRVYLLVLDKDEEKVSVFDIDQISYILILEGKIRKIKEVVKVDENMKLLKSVIQLGWLECRDDFFYVVQCYFFF